MNRLKRMALTAVVSSGLVMGAPGCAPPAQGNGSRSSGSLALSSDDSLLYAVDTDNGILAIIDVATSQKFATVKVGSSPVRVLVAADDTIFVANRGSNSVSVIRKGAQEVAATLEVGNEPTGLALSGDGRQLLVTSSTARDTTTHGTLTAFDTGTLEQQFELAVGNEPRAVAVVAGNKALVSLYKEGEVAVVDLNRQALVNEPSKAPLYTAANTSRVAATTSFGRGFSSAGASTFRPRAANDLITTPDGNRVFSPLVWAREDAIARRPSSSGGYYSAGGPCSIGAVATAGLVAYDTSGNGATPLVDDLTACASLGTTANLESNFPASTLASPVGGPESAVQGPTVGVMDPTGSWLFVVNRESKNVAVLPANRRNGEGVDFETTGTSIRALARLSGGGADGIALTRDGTRAFVYSQFDHQVETIVASGRGTASRLRNTNSPIRIADDVLNPRDGVDFVAGRKLFFDATNVKVSSAQTTVACSTCHLEGREDGHVWMFPDGPRQTPALAGRRLLETAPFHWSGEFATINDFNVHTVRERMGGSGLSVADAKNLDGWINQLPRAPSSVVKDLDAIVRGRAAFEKAQCATCHTGSLLTNNSNQQVGTLNVRSANANEHDNGLVVTGGFNVPSLIGVSRSAPYLHDGSEATLEQRVWGNASDLHGKTSSLTDAEKTELVTYLKSL